MTTDTWNSAIDDASSAVSWKAIMAGSTASIALSLVLAAFGVGVGFSVVSPWSDSGVSGTTFTIAAGVYLIVVAMLSSTIGGYLAGRLRSQWKTVHDHERYFRDSAHGFLVWAFAAVVSAAVLGGAFTHILAGASAGLVPAATSAAQGSPTDVYLDKLLRTELTQASAAQGTPTAPAPDAPTASPLQGGLIAGSAPANRPLRPAPRSRAFCSRACARTVPLPTKTGLILPKRYRLGPVFRWPTPRTA